MSKGKGILKGGLIPIVFAFVFAVMLASCGSGGGGGGGGQRCDIVANAQGPGYLKVINNLSTGLEWYMMAYGFAAEMQPGECTIFGVSTNRTHTVELTRCNIADEGCSSNFGSTISKNFTVADGETYTINVTASFFQ